MRQPDETALLRVQNLSKVFRSGPLWDRKVVNAVKDVSFSIPAGGTFSLVGESGSGKSTTARMAIRLIDPSAGTVFFRDTDLMKLSAEDLRKRRRDFQMVFQDPYGSLNARRTVEQLLIEPLEVHHWGDSRSRRPRLEHLLDQVGLPHTSLDRYPHEFSGGQRQRISIARALAVEPTLVVADEPVSALDVSVQAQVLNLMRDLQDELGLTYLFISHDLNVVKFMGGNIGVMKDGQLVEVGEAESVYAEPRHEYTRDLLASSPDVESGVRLHQRSGSRAPLVGE